MKIKELIEKDNPVAICLVAAVVGLVVVALCCVGLMIAGESVGDHLAWTGLFFVPVVLLVRMVAHGGKSPRSLKALVTMLFVLFIVYMFVLLKTKTLAL